MAQRTRVCKSIDFNYAKFENGQNVAVKTAVKGMDKSVYIKTEPGGKVGFGKLSAYELELFEKSCHNKTLSNDILYKVRNGLAPYKLVQGVINSGKSGDPGNEGIIEEVHESFSVPKDESGNYEKGVYLAYLALSKVSVEFQITNKSNDDYDPAKLVEVSVLVDLPSCVRHGRYSDLKFNIVTAYTYNGKNIKNANRSMVNRGFEESISIFRVNENVIVPLYEMVDGEEVFFSETK